MTGLILKDYLIRGCTGDLLPAIENNGILLRYSEKNLTVNIHSGLPVLSVTLDRTQEHPAVSFIKPLMVSDQIDWGNTFRFQIIDRQVEQPPRDALPAVFFFRKHGADIRRQILPVVKIIFDHAQTADDPAAVQTEIPAVFRFTSQIGIHAGQISSLGNLPLAVEPPRSRIFPLRLLP